MNPRTQLTDYLEWLCTMHADVQHDINFPDTRRFFQFAVRDTLIHGSELNNTGWNVIYDQILGSHVDGGRDNYQQIIRAQLYFVQHVRQGDEDQQLRCVEKGWDIGWEFIRYIEHQAQNKCDFEPPAGVTIPDYISWRKIDWEELSPLPFLADDYYGHRFSLEFIFNKDLKTAPDFAKWGVHG